ncbi:MAG: LuxR C-terminal-related transcriptional regulator, partial [Firmicutes bacterium]|nr:LuxR C-terminal-related transcriptional regulator [Bacillota bacterium]
RPEQSETAVFVRNILLVASESAKTYPGLTGRLESRLEEKPVKLSKQQMRMLLFLAAGKNNRQISEETGLNLNTVKAHLFKLYEKLAVNSATEAVLKAYRLGILAKEGAEE